MSKSCLLSIVVVDIAQMNKKEKEEEGRESHKCAPLARRSERGGRGGNVQGKIIYIVCFARGGLVCEGGLVSGSKMKCFLFPSLH